MAGRVLSPAGPRGSSRRHVHFPGSSTCPRHRGAPSPAGTRNTALDITSAVASAWTPLPSPPALVLPRPALQHHSPGRLITEVFLDCPF